MTDDPKLIEEYLPILVISTDTTRESLTGALHRKRVGPRSFLGRSGTNELWSIRTSASADGHAQRAREALRRGSVLRGRGGPVGAGCDKLCHGAVTSHADDKLATQLATSGTRRTGGNPHQRRFRPSGMCRSLKR